MMIMKLLFILYVHVVVHSLSANMKMFNNILGNIQTLET